MDEPEKPEEVVWTGKSDRKLNKRAEIFEPAKDGEGGSYRHAGHGGLVADGPPAPAETSPPAKPKPAAKPKPVAKEKPPAEGGERAYGGLPSPASHSRALAETVVGSFVERVKAEARRRGGTLTIPDLDAMSGEFEKKTKALQAAFEQSFEDYVSARERSAKQESRQLPFDRMIVQTFSHLFPGEGGRRLKASGLSRRMLPGFFMAMNMMVGADLIDEYQVKCARIAKDFLGSGGVQWEKVHADEEIRATTLDALIGMASHFEAQSKRVEWFITLVNSHLGPSDAELEGEEAAEWQLTEASFWEFLNALFSGVRETMASEGGRMLITKRHGAETCANLFDILKWLDRAGG